uniref:Uncharacterized protein n=1 Tax=Mycena chlorophos TaxID=658473 RepID=A0ABQ0LC89_MYCCL|nr:predicted protein [Mycena chlorophos]
MIVQHEGAYLNTTESMSLGVSAVLEVYRARDTDAFARKQDGQGLNTEAGSVSTFKDPSEDIPGRLQYERYPNVLLTWLVLTFLQDGPAEGRKNRHQRRVAIGTHERATTISSILFIPEVFTGRARASSIIT